MLPVKSAERLPVALGSLEVLVASLPGECDVALPLAAARTGATGLLNLLYLQDPLQASSLARELAQQASSRCGLILRSALGAAELAALEAVGSADLVLLAYQPDVDLAGAIARVRKFAQRVGIIVTSRAEAERALAAGCDLLVAKGHESGGLVSEETSFVLVQAIRALGSLPLYVWGGVSWNTAAACAAVGCAGVVLDWQLALLRESRLEQGFRRRLLSMDGSEVAAQTISPTRHVRFYHQPGMTARDRLEKLALNIAAGKADPADWQPTLDRLVAEPRERDRLWLAGQDATFAADWAKQAPSVGRALRLFEQRIAAQLQAAAKANVLAANSPLAQSHGTEFPIVQGPMTRVSDVPEFCRDVAVNGGLPFLALALMNGEQVRTLLEGTKALMGDRPWGVGMLGFVPQEIRAQQWPVIREYRPPFAIIAGGRPDQAAALEASGIATYLHVPSPGMLDIFLKEGARRFVFEGRECGGHVGPRTSFVLWEAMIRVLGAADLVPEQAAQVHVLFAGGIHDRVGAAMVAVLAQPLVERGMKVGVLLGTAYLFTHEIVGSGAIVDGFQSVALAANRTVVVESGPGHAIRCAPTDYVGLFDREKRRLTLEQRPAEDLRAELEHMNLGRLRIASKGVNRGESESGLVTVNDQEQRREGMYMIGQVAALRSAPCSLRELHEEVSLGSVDLLRRTARTEIAALPSARAPQPLDIAIVGISCLLPGAADPARLWHNILAKHDPIREIPADRFEADRWFDGDKAARDKIYGKWGGFVDDIPFDPLKYGIPPASIPSIEPMQLLAMELVDRALTDAGYAQDNPHRDRTSIVLGVGGGAGELGSSYAFRAMLPRFLENPDSSLWEQLPEWTEDSFAGILFNVVAGRVSNRFDFGGANCTIDAACASSLAAVYWSCHELASGHCDMAVTGGCDTMQNPLGYLCFAKAGALSPRGRARVFDADSDGIVISEGHAALVLKRREDAERDGDKIYGLIRAVASGSDGRSKGLTAPRVEGQLRTLHRAYEQAGVNPATVGLFEAHGTGTKVGDQTEGQSLAALLNEAGAPPRSIPVGSVKSTIGHTKCAAGAVGLIKALLALQHRVLPPTMHVENPNPKAGLVGGPLYVNSEARPWLTNAQEPRRAGVSSFGFGGANFHVLLEEYDRSERAQPVLETRDQAHEMFVLAGDQPAQLRTAAEALTKEVAAIKLSAVPSLFARLAYTCHVRNQKIDKPRRVAFVAGSLAELETQLAGFVQCVDAQGNVAGKLPAGVCYAAQPQTAAPIAFLFPGQGSQHPGMLQQLAVAYPEVANCLQRADETLLPELGSPLSRYVLPPPPFTDAERSAAVEALKATEITQPALGASGLAMLRLLEAFGVRAEMHAGHSFGELVALSAAGALSETELFRLAAARGRAMTPQAAGPRGAMLAVSANADQIEQQLAGVSDVWIANRNSPKQTVLSGSEAGIAAAAGKFEAAGFAARRIPVATAFHSPFMQQPREAFGQALEQTPFGEPTARVYSNVTAAPYGGEPEEFRRLLGEQLTREVRFVEQIEAMHRDGARIFVEVGPKSVLTSLVRDILRDRPHAAIATQPAGDDPARLFLQSLGQLIAHGAEVSLERLYNARRLEPLDRATLSGQPPAPLASHIWLVNGAYSRKASAPLRDTTPRARLAGNGPRPARTATTIEAMTAVESTAAPLSSPAVKSAPSMVRVPPSSPTPVQPIAHSVAASPMTIPVVASTPKPSGTPVTQPSQHHPAPPAPANRMHSSAAASQPAQQPGPGMAAGDYAVFQTTMRQFLTTQETVLRQLFGGLESAAQGAPAQSIPVEVAAQSIHQAPLVAASHFAEPIPAPIAPPAPHMVDVPLSKPAPVSAAVPVIPAIPPQSPEPVSAPVAKSPSAPATTAVISAGLLTQRLTSVVADRTGYPAEMLNVDINLEGELGIDSIKRVEIIAAFRREVLPAMLEPPAEFMERLTAAKTMRAIVEVVAAMDQGSEPAAVASGVAAAARIAAPPTATLDLEQLQSTLVRIVADRTGYPAEMLELDINLEGELGIDSIKRVEIIAAFRREIRPDMTEPPAALMERLTASKTMRAILDCFAEPVQPVAPAATVSHAEAPPAAEAPLTETSLSRKPVTAPEHEHLSLADACPRCLMEVVESPFGESVELPRGTVILTADGHGIADRWSEQLQAQGWSTAQLASAELADRETAARAVASIRAASGSIVGVAHLSPLDAARVWPAIAPAEWQAYQAAEVKGLLYLLQALEPELSRQDGPSLRVLGASLGGGDFSRVDDDRLLAPREAAHPWRAGLAALLKVAACERPQHAFRAVDFIDLPEVAILDRELRSEGPVEIGHRRGIRYAIQTRRADLAEFSHVRDAVPLNSESVVFVTGGAKGITAQIVAEMARHVPARFVLVGRSPLPTGEESAATAKASGDQALRQAIIADLRARSETCTPSRVEAELAGVKSDRELRRNLADIARAGAKVDYMACDLRDQANLRAALDAIRQRYGRIDAIVHGAGIIDDRHIKDKTAASFDRVIGVKVDPLLTMLTHIDLPTLKLLVLFGSTSGVFGNSGQCDYAVANETLNRLARRLRNSWSGKVVTLNWGPWAGAGMVTPEVAEKMRSNGVPLIPLEAGRAAAWREIAATNNDAPRVVLGRGPWLEQEQLRAGRLELSSMGPLLRGHAVEIGANGTVAARVALDPQLPYLQDHCIEGKAVLPVAMAVALMAETAQRAQPEWHVAAIENARMLGGITVEAAGREIVISAEPLRCDARGGEWRVRISGAELPQRTLYDAHVRLAATLPAAPELPGLSTIELPLPASASEAYDRWLFHGPTYQVIEGFQGADESGIDAVVRGGCPRSLSGSDGCWVIDPAMVDAAPQLAMIWSRALYDVAVLPSRISSYRVYEPVGAGKVEMRLRVRPNLDRQVYHAEVWIVRDGRVLAHMEGLEGAGSPHLNRIAASGVV